jgi:hypothetical protein
MADSANVQNGLVPVKKLYYYVYVCVIFVHGIYIGDRLKPPRRRGRRHWPTKRFRLIESRPKKRAMFSRKDDGFSTIFGNDLSACGRVVISRRHALYKTIIIIVT